MKDWIKILPIGIFVVAQTIYDNFATLQSTNWSIFYFSCQHLAWVVLSFIFTKGKTFKKSIPFYALASGFAMHIIRNISKIGMDYEQFMIDINNYEANLLISIYIIFTLIVVVKWQQ